MRYMKMKEKKKEMIMEAQTELQYRTIEYYVIYIIYIYIILYYILYIEHLFL